MNNQNIEKRKYSTPLLELIRLDNEISLILASDPPTYESSNSSNKPEYFNHDPFKSNLS